jgi:hypothetical protein
VVFPSHILLLCSISFLVVRFHPLAKQTFVVGLERGMQCRTKKKRIIIILLLEFLKFSNFFFIIIQTSFLVRFQTRPTPSKEKKVWL